MSFSPEARWQESWRLALLFAVFAGLGWLIGDFKDGILLAGLLYLLWHYRNLRLLNAWFSKPKKVPLPEAFGLWGEIYDSCYRLQLRNRKRKRKLANMFKQIQDFASAMPDATVILSPRYEIEWFNTAAHKLLGLRQPHDVGQPIINFLRSPSFCHYLVNGTEKESLKITSPANEQIVLRLSVVPYTADRFLLLARDVTQLHRLEQVRRDFVANVSHELRTPLTVITGFLETMRDSEDEWSEQWERPLFLMTQQAARMRNIVEDLLLLSKLEAENHAEHTETVDVPELLETIKTEACLLSGEQQHQIELIAEPNLLLRGNASELQSAFSNIVFNAVRYTPAQGKISLRWYYENYCAYFSVQDTGDGIAAEHIPRLTERFYRVDVGRSRGQGGTGLGLAIVKHVLNRHEGHLKISSELGKGSIFCCEFPKARIVLENNSEYNAD